MKTFQEWLLTESKRGMKMITLPKADSDLVGNIDLTKVPKGHPNFGSGAGKHGMRKKPRDKNLTTKLNKYS
jgi:hypothetical protein